MSTPGGDAICFPTFTAAIAAATNGRVTDAPASPAEDPGFSHRIDEHNASAGFDTLALIIGIAYTNRGFGGDSWTWRAANPCDDDKSRRDYAVENLNAPPYDSFGLNDDIESFEAFGNCGIVMYQHWQFFGAATAGGIPVRSGTVLPTLGLMNNEASSVRFF